MSTKTLKPLVFSLVALLGLVGCNSPVTSENSTVSSNNSQSSTSSPSEENSSIQSSSSSSNEESSSIQQNLSLDDLLTNLNISKNYHMYLNDSLRGSSVFNLKLDMTFNESYVYINDLTDHSSFGYANWDDGIVKFSIDNDVLTQGHYLTKERQDVWNYPQEIKTIAGFDMSTVILNEDGINGEIDISDKTGVATLLKACYLTGSDDEIALLQSIKVKKVGAETVKFTFDFGLNGTCYFNIDAIESANIEVADQYIAAHLGPKAIDSSLAQAKEKMLALNYSWQQDDRTLNSNKVIQTATYYYNPNYSYTDYTDDYLQAMQGSYFEDQFADSGFVKIGENSKDIEPGLYYFVPNKDSDGNYYLDASCLKNKADNAVKLECNLAPFTSDYLDYFDELGNNIFASYNQDCYTDVLNKILSGDSSTAASYNFNASYIELKKVGTQVNEVYLGLKNDANQAASQQYPFTNFGKVSIDFIENFLTSIK